MSHKSQIHPLVLSKVLRDLPQLEIFGRRSGWKIDNRDPKPRETVIIKFGLLPRFEAAAEFYAYLAYPDQIDATRRENYRIALSRWAVMERAKIDKEWKESTNLKRSIRPLIFGQTEEFFQRQLRGTKMWWDRAVLSSAMLLPHLTDLEGLAPQVQNIAAVVGRQLGYKRTSYKTVESDIWAPAKPVAHALTAVMVSLIFMRERKWEKEYHLCNEHPLLATFFYENLFVELLALAELFRVQVPSCSRFKIREEQMIRFLDPIWL